MWQSTAKSFVGYRTPGSTDRLLAIFVVDTNETNLNDPIRDLRFIFCINKATAPWREPIVTLQ